jgi:hypothetical protein
MKKTIAALLFVMMTATVFGAEVLGRRLLGLDEYIKLFSDNQPLINSNGVRIANTYYSYVIGDYRDAIVEFARLDERPNLIDTALE